MTDPKPNPRKSGLSTQSPLNMVLAAKPRPATVRNRSGEVRTLRAENAEFVRWQGDGWPMISTRQAWEKWSEE